MIGYFYSKKAVMITQNIFALPQNQFIYLPFPEDNIRKMLFKTQMSFHGYKDFIRNKGLTIHPKVNSTNL